MTMEGSDDLRLHKFLIFVAISMVPLVYVDAVIGSCGDPRTTFCKFAHKIVILHVVFLCLRIFARGNLFVYYVSIYGFVVSALTAAVVFPREVVNMKGNADVIAILVLASVASLGTTGLAKVLDLVHVLSSYYSLDTAIWSGVIDAIGEFIEIVAFVPAAWIIFSESKKESRAVDEAEFKRSAIGFTVFAMLFYAVEDVYTAYYVYHRSKFETCSHMLHFVLLADFCFYLMACVFTPDKVLNGTFLQQIAQNSALDRLI